MNVLHHPFDLIAPTAAIGAILLMPLGPLLIPRTYLIFLFFYFTTYLYLSINHFFKFCITARKVMNNARRWHATQQRTVSADTNTNSATNSPTPTRTSYTTLSEFDDVEASLKLYEDPHWIHAFIIPNYAEPEALLRDTIKRLASHRNAQTNYVIILAMEASESNHEFKAQSLQDYFAKQFLHFIVTVHPSGIPGEARGKGSNVAYAAKAAAQDMIHRNVEKRRVVFTVTDSDSAIPELYIKEVEKALSQAEDPYTTLCSPPIFFSRNAMDVPAAVRVTDTTWSIMVMQNLSNSRGLAFPCSTYSLSMVLAERVGYWDVDADSVGEDMHMWLKCFFKTDGLARSVPIFVPINLTNVQTTGYVSNLYARYVQATRHMNGVADVTYTLKGTFTAKHQSSLDTKSGFLNSNKQSLYSSFANVFDKIVVCFHVLEAHMIPCTSGWLMFAAVPVMQFLLFPPHPLLSYVTPSENPILNSEFYATLWNLVKIITVLLPMPLFGMLAVYENLHRTVDRKLLLKADSRTWKNAFDYVWLPVAAWLFLTLPSTVACVKRLVKYEDKYVVAEKIFEEPESDD
ncbi:glycosyl transferase family group 2-domain-containing protein [Jimgerdemannia flammicorona]|uniref:Glycosyl transferase family group 2-domain-containing protein n=1 Tax=Jimgerdemannia flammicorona TaxID=994334 RepID=A0A433CZQ5_9FUNG|nr:glycosyl transferase family group 2-domain-containing protein [Jimgerdemannia flammicorona]